MTRRDVLGALASAVVPLAFSGCGPQSCVDAAVPNPGDTLVSRGRFASQHVRGVVHWALAYPGRRAPDAVAYVLSGRGSTAETALGLGLEGFLADYVRHGGRRFALAFVDAGESYFHPRASGEDRLAMVTDELPRELHRHLEFAPAREAMMGQSMGGYGALLAAEREPRRFRAVAVAGPAIFPSYEDEHRSVGDAFDSAADYAKYDVIGGARALRGRPVIIAIGRRDPFVPGVRMFAEALPSARILERPGCHDDGFWRASAASLIAFVGAHL